MFNQSNQNLRQLSKKLYARFLPRSPVSFLSNFGPIKVPSLKESSKKGSEQNQNKYHHNFSERESSLAERCIGTSKNHIVQTLWKEWVLQLQSFFQKLVKLLSSRINSNIEMAPLKVKELDTKKNLQMLNADAVANWRLLQKTSLKKAKFMFGDIVHCSYIKCHYPVQKRL